MTSQAHLSAIQILRQQDGSMRIKDLPHVNVETIQEQGAVTGRNWQAELGLPTYHEEWEAMARIRGLSSRHIRFVLMDESITRLPGNPRLQPQQITLPPSASCSLELGHTGFVVGAVYTFLLGFDELRTQIPSMFGFEPPNGLEGDYIIGQAQLFDSLLADKAWEGLQRGIFTHTCPLLFRHTEEPAGTGKLVEVALTPGDYPGCPGAGVLKIWDAGGRHDAA